MLSDIQISDTGELVCDRDGLPVMITHLAVVSQDIKHAILESGLLPFLVAERSKNMRTY